MRRAAQRCKKYNITMNSAEIYLELSAAVDRLCENASAAMVFSELSCDMAREGTPSKRSASLSRSSS